MVPALEPGIELHVRNKHLTKGAGFSSDRILLMVHGATFPSEVGFDIDLPGGSWMDYLARRGYDVYFVDIRGYGRSTRPAAMSRPPGDSAPFATTSDAVSDVSVAVEFILRRRGVQRLNLLGWSWGTTVMAGYAAANPSKVERLVLYAPVWHLPASLNSPALTARRVQSSFDRIALEASPTSSWNRRSPRHGSRNGGRRILPPIPMGRDGAPRCCVHRTAS